MPVNPNSPYKRDIVTPAAADVTTPAPTSTSQRTAQTSSKSAKTSENELQTIGHTQEKETFPKEKYSSSDWENISFKNEKFLWMNTGAYIFTASDGTTIKLDDIEGVVIKQNKKTGEIVIAGAKEADITGSSSNVKLTVYDSDINSIKTKKGNDSINLFNTEVNTIDTGKGNDSLNIENSTVTGTLTGSDGDDYIHSLNSNIFALKGGSGDDSILTENSIINEISAGKGNDIITINSSSSIETLKGDDGNDIISLNNSSVTSTDGSKGADNIYIVNSKTVVKEDKKDTVNTDTTTDTNVPAENIPVSGTGDISDTDTAVNITASKTSGYNHELTPEEQMQAISVNFFEDNLKNIQAQFEEQENSDGVASDAYNWVKELVDMGVAKSDIQSAMDEQQQMINEMKAAINGEGDETFEEVFKRWTGVEYSEENVSTYLESAQIYTVAVAGIQKTENFKEALKGAKNLEEVLNIYTGYYGDEELGRQKLNEFLHESLSYDVEGYNFATTPPAGFIKSIEINENNELVVTRPINCSMYGPEEDTEFETTTEDISGVVNMIDTLYFAFDLDKYTTEFKENVEKAAGCSLEQMQNEYASKQLSAFGRGTSFQKMIDRYCAEQEGFADKLSAGMQIAGVGLMAAGGILCIACPPAAGVGLTMMQTGKYTAIAGTFADNGIQLLDDFTSENGMTKEQFWNTAKETLQEVILLYSGAKINGVAAGVNKAVLTETQSKTLAFLSQLGTDVSMSLLTDLVITGEVNLSGEGMSQILGIITGLAGAKVNQYTKESFEAADELYKANDIDGARSYLKQRGFSKQQIDAFIKSYGNGTSAGTNSFAEPKTAQPQQKLTELDETGLQYAKEMGWSSQQCDDYLKFRNYGADSWDAKDFVNDGWGDTEYSKFAELVDSGISGTTARNGINAGWTDAHWKCYNEFVKAVNNPYSLSEIEDKINFKWSADEFGKFTELYKADIPAEFIRKGIDAGWTNEHWETYKDLKKFSDSELSLGRIRDKIDVGWSAEEFAKYAEFLKAGDSTYEASAKVSGTQENRIHPQDYKLNVDPETGKQILSSDMFFIYVDGYKQNVDWGEKMADATEATSELVAKGADYDEVMNYFIEQTRPIQAEVAKSSVSQTGRYDYAMTTDYGVIRLDNEAQTLATPLTHNRYSYYIDMLMEASGETDPTKSVSYNKTSEEFPLAKTTNVMIMPDSDYATLRHPAGSGNIEIAKTVYDDLIKINNPTTDEVIEHVAKMHWLLAQNAPFGRGSDSIASGLSKAIFRAYNIEVSPLKEGVSIDFEAFSTNMEDFVANYKTFFEVEPAKIK